MGTDIGMMECGVSLFIHSLITMIITQTTHTTVAGDMAMGITE
jgi:hypothetical protein